MSMRDRGHRARPPRREREGRAARSPRPGRSDRPRARPEAPRRGRCGPGRRRAGPRRRPPRRARGSGSHRRRPAAAPATSRSSGRATTGPVDEDLAATGVDHRPAAVEGEQRRDAGGGDVEREREAARGREPDPDRGEAARAGADDEARRDLAGAETGVARVSCSAATSTERASTSCSPSGSPSTHERARRPAWLRCQRRRSSSLSILMLSAVVLVEVGECHDRGAARGSQPPACSGHSTKEIVPSKYGSRSAHCSAPIAAMR